MNIRVLIGMLLISLVAVPARAQLCFDEQVVSSDLDRLGVTAVVDMNNDGHLDIVAATSSSIHWYQNDGAGNFISPVDIVTPAHFTNLDSFEIVRLVAMKADTDNPGLVAVVAINQPTTALEYDLIYAVGETAGTFVRGVYIHTAKIPLGVTPENLIFANMDGNGSKGANTTMDIVTDGIGTVPPMWFKLRSDDLTYDRRLMNLSSALPGRIVAVGDMDGKDHLDLVLDTGEWYSNDAAAYTLQSDIHPLANGDLRVVDINGDGHMDLLSDSGLWFRHNGQASPLFDVRVATSLSNAGHLIPADLDGDGDLDLVGEGDLDPLGDGGFWFENFGGFQAEFGARMLPSGPSTDSSLTVADIDGDGDLDIVVQDGSGWYRNTHIEYGSGVIGPASFELASIGLINPDSVPDLALGHLGDFDFDGDLDSVKASAETGLLSWHMNSDGVNGANQYRSGSLAELVANSTNGNTLTVDAGLFECLPSGGLTVNKDLVISSLGGIQTDVNLFLGNDALIAEAGSRVTLFGGTWVDGDASLQGTQVTVASDLLFGVDASLDVTGDLVLHGTLHLNIATSIEDNSIFGIRSADIDGDGFDDLVISGNSANSKPGWIRNDAGQWPNDPMSRSQLLVDDTKIPGYLGGFDLGDINGDGLVDLVGVRGNALELYLNDAGLVGSGMLSNPDGFDNNVALNGPVAVGDIDGDGKPDVVHTGGDNGTDIFWYRNIYGPKSLFEAKASIWQAPGSGAYSIDLVDMDFDGDLDVLAGYKSANSGDAILWYETIVSDDTKPIVSFVRKEISPLAGSAFQVIGADMDGDGDVDVVSGFGPGDKIAWFENSGTSEVPDFSNPLEHLIDPLGTGKKSLAVADLDNDGDLDIISGNRVMYLNDGEQPPSFRRRRDFQADRGDVTTFDFHDVTAFDFNNDRVIDFVGSDPINSNNESPVSFFTNSLDVLVDMDNSGSVLSSTGDIRAETAQIKLGPSSNIVVGGKFVLSPHARLEGSGEITSNLGTQNAGEIVIPQGTGLRINGDYAQFVDNGDGSKSAGMLGVHIHGAGQQSPLLVTGQVSLAGGLRIDGFSPDRASQGELFPVILPVGGVDQSNSDFDAIIAPIIEVLDLLGEPKLGTLVRSNTSAVNGFETFNFEAITLEELFFSPGEFGGFENPNDAVLADVTGDGTPDLVVAVPSILGDTGAVAVLVGEYFKNDGSFRFAGAAFFVGDLGAVVDAPVAVEVGNFDADETYEIVYANRGDNSGNNDIHFLQYDPIAGFSSGVLPEFDIFAGGVVTDLAVGDLMARGTTDSEDDLAVAVQGSEGSGSVVNVLAFDDDKGGWGSCPVDVDDIDSVDTFPNSAGSVANATVFDSIVYTSPESDTATIILDMANIGTVPPVVIPTGVRPTEVLAGDLNGDLNGYPEIVIICEGNSTAGVDGVLTVVRNLGPGAGFAPPVNLPLIESGSAESPNPVSLALVNLDADADLDIAVVSTMEFNEAPSVRVRVIRNTSAGGGSGLSFTAIEDSPNQPLNGIPTIIRSADLDNDSQNADDLVVLVEPSAPLLNGESKACVSKILGITPAPPPCPADLTGDGLLDFFDVSEFLVGFGNNDPVADFTGDGSFDFFDVSQFLNDFGAGCP